MNALESLVAIAEPTRMEIAILLAKRGRMNVGEIASHFRISRPAISHHLKTLRIHGLVYSEKVGQQTQYWVDLSTHVALLRKLADEIEQVHQARHAEAGHG